MKLKIVFQLIIAAMLCAFGSGCCTYLLVDSAKYTTHDTFNPSAVYLVTNRPSFALEGTRYNNSSEQGLSNSNLAFVILPKAKLLPANLRTNATLSIDNIQTLPTHYTKGLKTKTTLPPNYQKIATLSTNDTYLTIKDHHPKRAYYFFVPLTVAADIVTAPIQIAVIIVFWAKT